MENKTDNGENMVVIKMAAVDASPAFPKMKINKSKGSVTFGPDDDFPQYLINLNSKSPVNASIIESTVTFICGKGVRDSETNTDKFISVPHAGGTWDELIERVARDYKTFGGFYLQVILNKDSSTVSVYHEDYSTVRIGKIDELGKPLSWILANDWPKGTKNKSVELDAWTGLGDMQPGKRYLFHYWDYAPGLRYYSVPGYYPAIDYVKADGTLAQFYNNSIDNGFTPSVVISMPNNPSPEKKEVFQKKMESAFSGAKGACAIVVLWGEDTNTKPEVTPFTATANANVYNEVEAIVFQKIISAHRLSSPTLAGVSGSGNLSGNAAEIIDAYVLYNYTVIEKMRRKILDNLNIFTKINGTDLLQIDELDVLKKIRETEEPSTDAAPEVEEDAPATLQRQSKFLRALKHLIKWK